MHFSIFADSDPIFKLSSPIQPDFWSRSDPSYWKSTDPIPIRWSDIGQISYHRIGHRPIFWLSDRTSVDFLIRSPIIRFNWAMIGSKIERSADFSIRWKIGDQLSKKSRSDHRPIIILRSAHPIRFCTFSCLQTLYQSIQDTWIFHFSHHFELCKNTYNRNLSQPNYPIRTQPTLIKVPRINATYLKQRCPLWTQPT